MIEYFNLAEEKVDSIKTMTGKVRFAAGHFSAFGPHKGRRYSIRPRSWAWEALRRFCESKRVVGSIGLDIVVTDSYSLLKRRMISTF